MAIAITVVWLIPGVNPAPTSTPLWAVLPALALAVGGTIVYKRWELAVEAAGAGVAGADVPGLQPVPDRMHTCGGRERAACGCQWGGVGTEGTSNDPGVLASSDAIVPLIFASDARAAGSIQRQY